MTDINDLANFLNILDTLSDKDRDLNPVTAAFFNGDVVSKLRGEYDYPQEIEDTLDSIESEEIQVEEVKVGDIFADTMGTIGSFTATGQAIIGKVTRAEREGDKVTLYFGELAQTYTTSWYATRLIINDKPLFDGEPVVMVQQYEGGLWDLAVRVSNSQYGSKTRYYNKTDHVHKWARVVVDYDIENSLREYVKD